MIENLEQKVFKKFESYNDDLFKLQNEQYKVKSEIMIIKNSFEQCNKQILVNSEKIDQLFNIINELKKNNDKGDAYEQLLKDAIDKLKDYVDVKINEYNS
jgi:thymidylate synthase